MNQSGTESIEHATARPVIAIVGGSGYIGRYLIKELRRLDFSVKVLVRSASQAFIAEMADVGAVVCHGDLLEPESLRGFLEKGCTVVNLVYLWNAGEAINLEVTHNLLAASKEAGIDRMIHCSTAAVVGRVKDDLITEQTPCMPVTEYGETKLKVEQAIIQEAEGRFDVAILRPTSVFGPAGNPLQKLADDIVSGSRLKNYLKSCLFGKRRMNLVPVANVVGAIVFLIRREENLAGEKFIVSEDGKPNNNFVEVEKFLMKRFGIDDYMFPRITLPLGLLSILLAVLGRNNVNPRCNFAQDKLEHCGFQRNISFDEALGEYADWYVASKLTRS